MTVVTTLKFISIVSKLERVAFYLPRRTLSHALSFQMGSIGRRQKLFLQPKLNSLTRQSLMQILQLTQMKKP